MHPLNKIKGEKMKMATKNVGTMNGDVPGKLLCYHVTRIPKSESRYASRFAGGQLESKNSVGMETSDWL